MQKNGHPENSDASPLTLEYKDLTIAKNNALTSNKRLPEPINFHADISNETVQTYLLPLTKEHDTVWAA